MIFHGSEVVAGDKVYDVALGWGTVKSTSPSRGGFDVLFGNRKMFYTTDGKAAVFNANTLFWANPICGIKPDKKGKYWAALVGTTERLSEELNRIEARHG